MGKHEETDGSEEEERVERRRDTSSHKKKRKREESSSDGEATSSSSDDSGSSSSESSSSDDERVKKHRKNSKKGKKEKKEKKEKKRKKEKKKKKKRKEEAKAKKAQKKKEKDFYSAGCVTNQYGKYGLLQESDMWQKRAEFSLWLMEVKDKNLEELSGWEERELFRDYMEDYNTATFPSKKYYNLELFEAKQRLKRTNLQETRELTDFNDEARRKREIKTIQEQRRIEETKEQLRSMREDRDKVHDMRHQQLLKSKIETLYRMGANAEAKKLAELLEPDK
ncbi:u4 tri-snrnp-associated [Cystoisospora suis]|uniref:U4 tri-snrnp-associated n=1 Tax=Cystoisospora suis TaxID=483139 RepID=A0A2C6LA59_9APIC|nr:u4 tri-snrnp-associated [Cystoisospora suis]